MEISICKDASLSFQEGKNDSNHKTHLPTKICTTKLTLVYCTFPGHLPIICCLHILLYFLIPLVSAASWRENTLISLSQTIATSESLRNCWICHLKLETISVNYVPFMVLVTDFSTVPEPITYYTLPPPATTFKVRITILPEKIQIPCLILSEEIVTGGKVTTGPPRSPDFTVKKCDKKKIP